MTSRLLLTAVSGWFLVLLLAATIRLPYRLREPLLAGIRAFAPRQRLRFHYWLGYGIAVLTLGHSFVPMTPLIAGRATRIGRELASLAMLLVLLEVALGLWLRRRSLRRPVTLRRVHFWVMIGLVALVVVHVGLDSSLLGTFRPAP
jgi:hypothetical protein